MADEMNRSDEDRKSSASDPDMPLHAAHRPPERSEKPEAFGVPAGPAKPPEAFGRPNHPATTKKSNGQTTTETASPENEREETAKDEQPDKPPFYKRPLFMTILIVVVVLLIVGGIVFWLYERHFESTDDAYIDGHVVQISPKVAALVKAVHVDDNQRVTQGDVLIELDPRDYQAAADQAKAEESAARGKLAQAQTQLDVARARVGEAAAQVTVAQTSADNANRDYERWRALDERARSQQQMDNATAAQRSTAAQLQQAKANQKAVEAQVVDAAQAIKSAQAQVAKAAADVQQAELNLSYCTIRAPADGMVTRKNVEPGQYVQAAQPVFSIVPTDVWVTANFKETQLDLMRIGQPVDVKIDAYGGLVLHGHVDSIQNGTGSRFSLLPAENATGNFVKVVQRVPVKIVFDSGQTNDSNHLLAPGLSVEPKVRVR